MYDEKRAWCRIHENGMVANVIRVPGVGRYTYWAGKDTQSGVAGTKSNLGRAQSAADAEARQDGHMCGEQCGEWAEDHPADRRPQ